MAERYIFNKSLNRSGPRWYWLAGTIAALLSFTVFVAPSKAQEPVLVDPQSMSDAQRVTTTITDVDFTQNANNTAITMVTFEGQVPKTQLIESQGKVSVTLMATKLGENQFVELDVVDFGTVVSTIETFEDDKSARVEVNYEGAVPLETR